MTADNNLLAELQALLDDGRKIEAIKRYREATGAGLAAAKEGVEALEKGESPSVEKVADSSLESEIVSLLQGEKKIEAIKLYRQRTGTGLKEAKDAVEAIAANHGIVAPRGSGCLGVILLLLAIPLAAAETNQDGKKVSFTCWRPSDHSQQEAYESALDAA